MKVSADQAQVKPQAAADSLQKQPVSDDASLQFADNRPESIAQRKLQEAIHDSPAVKQLHAYQLMANNSSRVQQLHAHQAMADNAVSQSPKVNAGIIQQRKNNTGLPDDLKAGMENLSGISLDDVRVHRNSDKPAQLQAHAYAQGSDIHLAPGQEQHLPHEAWHVVQQKQGRVKPTLQMKSGIHVNDDTGLEQEADNMGQKALQMRESSTSATPVNSSNSNNSVVQRVNWGAAKDTANHKYAITDGKTLYSKNNAPAPEPLSMYAKGTDTTTDLPRVQVNTWQPNVRFLSGETIDGAKADDEKKEGKGEVKTNQEILEVLGPEYLRIKKEVTDAIAAAPGRGGSSPTQGIIGMNDCANWAATLQRLIREARGRVADAETRKFDLGDAKAGPDMSKAPAVGIGTKMEQTLGEDAKSNYHGATVVATDGASVVTLEAHVEKKDLAAPEFHIYQGLGEFIDKNNEGKDGKPNTYLEDNGREGTVAPLGAARVRTPKDNEAINDMVQQLASEDADEKFQAITGLLRSYEEIKKPSKCFLTTACVNYRNLPDNCEELAVLRHFRDNYMAALPEGKSLIEKYYEVAPGIVAAIDRSVRRRDIYEELYLILRNCVEAIKDGNNQLALQVYKDMVIRLHQQYH